MCSVTWLRRSGGFELFMNRDELRAREPERSPRVHLIRGVRVAAPEDGRAGGSWIAVNEHGLALALLNANGAPAGGAPYASRGGIVLDLAAEVDSAAAVLRLEERELGRYRDFTLLLVDPERAVVARARSGLLELDRAGDAACPLLSSAFDADAVCAARFEEYRTRVGGGATAAALRAFHASHERGPSAFSVCMHRPDAETRSFVHVAVDAAAVALCHQAGAPCAAAPPVRVELARRSVATCPR